MTIHRWSEDVILVDLSRELEKHGELQTVMKLVHDTGDCDVLVDFSHIDVVGGACLAGLLEVWTQADPLQCRSSDKGCIHNRST